MLPRSLRNGVWRRAVKNGVAGKVIADLDGIDIERRCEPKEILDRKLWRHNVIEREMKLRHVSLLPNVPVEHRTWRPDRLTF